MFEMQKLRQLLEERCIRYEARDIDGLMYTFFRMAGASFSVAQGECFMGGKDGLLECFCYDRRPEPLGYLDAEDVMKYVEAQSI